MCFTLASVPFGKLDLTFHQDSSRYNAVSDVETTGIGRFFVKHTSHTTSTGTGENFNYPNVHYASDYATRGKKKSATFTKQNGTITSDVALPFDDRLTRPAVEQALKDKAYDPLAFGLALRTETARMIEGGGKSFSLDYYDGRRLTRADFIYAGEKNIRIHGMKYAVYEIQASRKPIAGFTKKELSRMEEKEPTLSIYFSRDERMLPIMLEVPMGMVTATATLVM